MVKCEYGDFTDSMLRDQFGLSLAEGALRKKLLEKTKINICKDYRNWSVGGAGQHGGASDQASKFEKSGCPLRGVGTAAWECCYYKFSSLGRIDCAEDVIVHTTKTVYRNTSQDMLKMKSLIKIMTNSSSKFDPWGIPISPYIVIIYYLYGTLNSRSLRYERTHASKLSITPLENR